MRGITFENLAHGLMSTAYNRDGKLPVVHPAISNRLSSAEQTLLNRSEELLLSNQWIEIKEDNSRVLTAEGRAEVSRRSQSDFCPLNDRS